MRKQFIQAKPHISRAGRTVAPLFFVLAFGAIESRAAGLSDVLAMGQTLLAWLRNLALIIFVACLIWGCCEVALESWREGRPRIFAAVACGIIAGVAQGLITAFYSTTG